MYATDGIRPVARPRGVWNGWPLADVAVASLGVVLALGCFLVVRRAVGALSAPLPGPRLAATAGLLFAWAVLVQALLKRKLGPVRAFSLPLAALLLFAVACSYPGPRVVDWAAWLTAITAFMLSNHARRIAGGRRSRNSGERGSPATAGEMDAGQVVQQLTRYRTAAGQDVVRGTLAAQFAPGERTTTLYVAFCPPFERLPDVEVEVVEDSFAAAKLVQVLHNGIQVEVRLAEPVWDRRSLAVEFFAAEPTGMR